MQAVSFPYKIYKLVYIFSEVACDIGLSSFMLIYIALICNI